MAQFILGTFSMHADSNTIVEKDIPFLWILYQSEIDKEKSC